MKPAIALLALLIGLCAPASRAADILNMGFYLPGIRDANLADVHITLQIWAEEVGKAHGIDATAHTYSDMAALYRDSMSGKINLIVAPGMEIAETFAPEELAPGFVGKHHGTGEGLALIVRASDSIRQFGDLRGKKVLHLSNDRLSTVFLENQCRQHTGAACADLFQVNEEKRNSQAIHKVFFGQADAALVSISALHAATELNPQIRQRLHPLLEWKIASLSYGMMLIQTDMMLRERVLKSAIKATTSVRGKQILEIFKTDFMERVDPRELQPYWQLHRDHQAWVNRKARKK